MVVVAEVAERVQKVFTNVKILLEGCIPAEDTIQSLLDRLGAKVYEAESSDAYVRDEANLLVYSLSQCSDGLFVANSSEDFLRVEVVNRLLFSTLHKFTELLDGLAYLEKLTQEQHHLNKEILAYGYEGVTLTRTGSLQIEITKLMDSGKLVLQNACLLEPLLVDERIGFWLWDHFGRLALCFRSLSEYEGSIPWFEASLKMAKVERSNLDFGFSLLSASVDSVNTEKKEEWWDRGLTILKNGIKFCENETLDDALELYGVHMMIADIAYSGRKDFSLSLEHFAKAVEIAATNSLHLKECFSAVGYGSVLLDAMPDKLGEIRASFRRSLEAVLKVIPWTSVRLSTIHNATIYQKEVIFRSIESFPSSVERFSSKGSSIERFSSKGRYHLIDGEQVPYLCWIHPEVWTDLACVLEDPTSWIVARARALYILGYDYYYDREFDRAVEMMLNGISILEAEPRTDEIGHHSILLGVIHYTLGEIYYYTAKYKEAAEQFYHCGQLHDLKNDIRRSEGLSLYLCGDNVRALAVFKELLLQSLPDSDLWEQRATILTWKGTVELTTGDIDKCILSLEEARTVHEEENTLAIDDLVPLYINLVQAYLQKYEYLAASHLVKRFQPIIDEHHKGDSLWQVWQAITAVGHEMVGDLRSAEKAIEQVNDPDLVVLDVTNSSSMELLGLRSRSSVYRCQADIDSALENYDQMEELIKDSEGEGPQVLQHNSGSIVHDFIIPGEIHLNRAAVLLRASIKGPNHESNLQRACDESQQAALLLRKEGRQELLLARALACQASVILNLSILKGDNQRSKSKELIEEAIGLVETQDSLLLAKFKYIKAGLLDPFAAEAEAREAILIFAEHQLQLRDMESAWVSMFGFEMKHLFIFMQLLSMDDLQMPMKALLWAERGRTRLFVYIVRKEEAFNSSNAESATDSDIPLSKCVDKLRDDLEHVQLQNNPGKVSCWKEEWLGATDGAICGGSQLVNKSHSYLSHESVTDIPDSFENAAEFSGLGELWFDKDDALAEKYLFEAVEQCGPEALILEYTYVTLPTEQLLVYGVFIKPGGRHVVECESLDVQAFIERQREGKKNWAWGRTLTSLISKTREYIAKKADDEAIEGLSLLHSVLIKPLETCVKNCQRLVLSAHEQLALVPFAALFNKQSGKFLVQEKTISYIPSIRVLHYCFHRQREFERQMQKGLLDAPFVAGNPEPMGWGMEPLPGAAEEAKLVAEMLGVRPCIGSDMTKKAVTAGLSKASLVLLATHGVVNTYFPHGALILQACNRAREDDRSATSLARTMTSGLRGDFFQRLRDSPNGNVSGDASIISDELASLPSGIRAGLVVLSACKSGEGEVTSEGVLGLGRAILQGGAPAAILALWEVADSSNKALIAGVFEQLVKHGKDAAEALQQFMLQMMESKEKYHIFHWAPLVVMGTPFFKYVQGPHSSGMTEA